MEYKYIKVIEYSKHIELVFNRPESLNAMCTPMLVEIASALADLSQAEQTILVMKGEGRAFCVGADLKERKQGLSFETYMMERILTMQKIASLLRNSHKLIIAVLKGHVIGGGVLVSLHADFRIAAENTVFRVPELEVGSTLLCGGYKTMIEAFGLAKTKELLFLCESFSVEEANQYNLVNTIVPSEKLDETVTQYIDKLSRISPAMLTLYKELLNHALDSRFDEVLSLEFVDAAINKHNK